MKAVSVLEHFSDHDSIHQKLKKNTASVYSIAQLGRITIHRSAVSTFYQPGFFSSPSLFSLVPTFFSSVVARSFSLYRLSFDCCQVQAAVPYSLFARRPVRCVPLTPAHRRRRSLRCREHRNWRDNEWGRVLFTDESRFSLSSDSHRILIWRERGSRNHPSNIIERDRYGVRGGLRRYGSAFFFLDDNAPCHRTVAAKQLLESEDIERMDWPARSPDLNPMEHVWDFLGRRLAARTLPPVTIRELRLALQDEWAAMP
ncbi:transposable element Tcb2 transposase [Trichonephila clavipes]|nr:transposable element Tcb2 transposase [Trichonephila clavipes]